MTLDAAAARDAVGAVAQQLGLETEQAALGIVQLANEHMAQALRVMSVQRGIDPRELTLVPFGGAGGLHVCALAEALEMRQAMVPLHAGVLSALGMLVAPRSRQRSQTINLSLDECDAVQLAERYEPLISDARAELLEEGVSAASIKVQCSVDVRYVGQSYYLNVPWESASQTARDFHALHRQRYGHSLDAPVEIVNIRVALVSERAKPELVAESGTATPPQTIQLAGITQPAQLVARAALQIGEVVNGPALITETVSTTYLAPGWQARKDEYGNLLLQRS